MTDRANDFLLSDLAEIIRDRAKGDGTNSYTKRLLDLGVPKIAKKFGEEAIELVIASVEGQRTQIVYETADVFYHLAVLLHSTGVTFDEILQELKRRTAQSGLEEKASRPYE